MKILLSPAKTLDFELDTPVEPATLPLFAAQAQQINERLRTLDSLQLQKLQGISDRLAELNMERNQFWQVAHLPKGKPALYVFKGDVYQGLAVEEWSQEDLAFAEERLVILSGLYGMLRPRDVMLPYRLEMGTPLAVGGASQLYEFWREPLGKYLEEHWPSDEWVINLASKEYFKVLQPLLGKRPVLECVFKDYSKGLYTIIPFFAKKARGLMARFIIQNRLKTKAELQAFNLDRYYYNPDQSTAHQMVFYREKQTT